MVSGWVAWTFAFSPLRQTSQHLQNLTSTRATRKGHETTTLSHLYYLFHGDSEHIVVICYIQIRVLDPFPTQTTIAPIVFFGPIVQGWITPDLSRGLAVMRFPMARGEPTGGDCWGKHLKLYFWRPSLFSEKFQNKQTALLEVRSLVCQPSHPVVSTHWESWTNLKTHDDFNQQTSTENTT